MEYREKENYDMKITEAEKKIIKGIKVGTENEMVRNPFSDLEVELSPEAVALYDVIIGCQISLESNHPYSQDIYILFNTAREVFIRNWPKEYMALLD